MSEWGLSRKKLKVLKTGWDRGKKRACSGSIQSIIQALAPFRPNNPHFIVPYFRLKMLSNLHVCNVGELSSLRSRVGLFLYLFIVPTK